MKNQIWYPERFIIPEFILIDNKVDPREKLLLTYAVYRQLEFSGNMRMYLKSKTAAKFAALSEPVADRVLMGLVEKGKLIVSHMNRRKIYFVHPEKIKPYKDAGFHTQKTKSKSMKTVKI